MSNLPSIEQLIELARSNPEQLENIRRREVDALIASAPEHMRRRLRGLQFQIDCKREAHRDSAMAACLAVSGMMLDSLHRLNSTLQGECSDDPVQTQQPVVIPFPAQVKKPSLHIQ